MKHKKILLALSVGIAALVVGAFVWWRYVQITSAPPPAQLAIIIDASSSMQRDCIAVQNIARRAVSMTGVKSGSTLTIIRTGDEATKLEPQLVFQDAIPGPVGAGPFSGHRRAQIAGNSFANRAKSACADIDRTNQSPIVKAVRRGLAHLSGLGCTRESGCLLVVISDLQDNDELAPTRRNAKAPAVLDNTGIRVALCGFSGTVQDGSAGNTDALLATWKGLFVEPVKFAPFCGEAILAEVQTNTQRRLMTYSPNDHNGQSSTHGPDLAEPLLNFSAVDPYTLGMSWEGTAIFGAPGTGKSTTSGKALAYAFLKTPMMGGLVLTAKAEETRNWIEYAKACGREKDLIIFNSEGGHVFDGLWYEANRPGRGAGDIESIIDLFSTLLSIGKTHAGMSSDRFWELAAEQLMRNVIVLLALSGEPLSITNMSRVVQSLPSRPGEFEEQGWQSESYCAKLIRSIEARKDTLTPEQWGDLDMATQYAFKRWPGLDERPRSSIEMTFSGMCDKFLFNPLNRIFCSGKCSFLPEQTTHQGKIVIVDFPMLEYGHEIGRLINCLIKLIFQRAWLRRDLSQSPNPCFLFQDEFQYFVTKRDNAFQQTCRSARVAVVCLTQNILNLSEELGEQQPGSKTKSFCANLATKIFHQQSCPDTNAYAADLIGKQYRYLDSFNSDAQGGASVGAAQQLVYNVEPIAFSQLTKPDSVSPISTAIVYQGGKAFNATVTNERPQGSNYLTVAFSRDV